MTADAKPAPAVPLPGGVSVRTAYRATDLRTAATVSGGESGDISCGQVAVRGVRFGALASGPPPAGVLSADRFDGSLTISLVTTTQRLLAAQVAPPGAGVPFPFAAAIQPYLASRRGLTSVAVYDRTTGETFSQNAGTHFVTASIVKVAVLGTLLRQAQKAGRSLTATELSLASRMIRLSDNNATTALWNKVGKGPGVAAFLSLVGMPSTTPGPGGFWGLTSTNTPDQLRLVKTIAYPNEVLTEANRQYAEALMVAVTPSQKWGVSAGVPASARVALKNGWLPRTGGWVINSIGHVRGGTRDYVIATLSSGKPSMANGIATLQHLSRMVWVSDLNGDGTTDLIARDGTGELWLYPGNGAGGFLARSQLGAGWASMTAILSPGDVTGDGHADILARDPAGALWLYPGKGAGGTGGSAVLGPRRKIGSGWASYTITSGGDLNGDGRRDVLALDRAGTLWLYPLHGNALWGTRIRVRTGLAASATILGPGDVSGDGLDDVLARDPAGRLLLYRGNGDGGAGAGALVSTEWSNKTLATPGNWDRTGGNDLLARDAAGGLWLYPGQNAGKFGAPRQIGEGFSGLAFIG
jgi:beta-lactamase class A